MKSFKELYKKIEQEALKNRPRNLAADFGKNRGGGKHPLILYGAGGNCEFAMFTCLWYGIEVTGVCDSIVTGTYRYKNQIYEIISPDELFKNYSNAFVLITSWQFEQEIRDFLRTSGFPDTQIYFLRNPNTLTPKIFRENYLAGYQRAYKLFTDVRSRQRILDKVRFLLLGEPCTPDSVYTEGGYFAFPDIALRKNEVYVDGGAYIGDTAEEFIISMKEKGKDYRHIYSFEPDPSNYKRAVQNLSGYERIDLIPCGISSRKTELRFASSRETEGLGSHMMPNDISSNNSETLTIPTTSLDQFFADKPKSLWPTIIKIDIEGGEKEALIGAQNIIKAQKPQLIVCAYHKPEDIYELPETILKIRDDYRLSLWQIGQSFWDLILYAV